MIKYSQFPELSHANEDGLLAMGGNLNTDTLVSAYVQGIFPWFNEDQPILWWSPDPRLVLFPERVRITRSLRKSARNGMFRITCNTAFSETIQGCATRGQTNAHAATWITSEMRKAYEELHQQSYAHSIEVWREGQLVGGLYGIALGSVFFGESMFSRETDASKIALWALCTWLQKRHYKIIDCQVTNDHLLSLGAEEIPRDKFLSHLNDIDINSPDVAFSTEFENFISPTKLLAQT